MTARIRPLTEAHLATRRSEKWAVQPDGVLASTIAEMDFEIAPEISNALRAALDRHDLGYTPKRVDSLATAFAGFAARRMRWQVDPEQVVPVTDVTVAVTALCAAFAGRSGTVAFASLNYPPFFSELRNEAVPVGLRDDGRLDLGQLEEALKQGTRVLLLTSPHNPTGRVAAREELAAIAELCAEHETWVVVDEIHAPLTLAGATHVPWLEVSDAAREWGVSLTSASKAFNVAALKCALATTASGHARDAVSDALGDPSDHVGLLGVLAAEAAFEHGDAWLDALLAQLDANRATLGRRLAAELPEISWRPPDASFVAWLDCRELDLGDDPAETFLHEGRVALSSGLDYGGGGTGHVRLNFGAGEDVVEETVRRMAAAVRRRASAA